MPLTLACTQRRVVRLLRKISPEFVLPIIWKMRRQKIQRHQADFSHKPYISEIPVMQLQLICEHHL